ncbi:putative site-specific DNA-methyltransferase (ISS) [Dorcoceras hygrometricum]|uniref:Putative site-specific DNA-methyltransferase (ISS) n=1 Tax=Dorcoceras hygrometricum TaxID=472368 RepID=A0A2Z7CZ02_9LAMI|nr:putative site-specific DNA-methyltransferase (ISS) [Dorcoceras hygrometricum]
MDRIGRSFNCSTVEGSFPLWTGRSRAPSRQSTVIQLVQGFNVGAYWYFTENFREECGSSDATASRSAEVHDLIRMCDLCA